MKKILGLSFFYLDYSVCLMCNVHWALDSARKWWCVPYRRANRFGPWSSRRPASRTLDRQHRNYNRRWDTRNLDWRRIDTCVCPPRCRPSSTWADWCGPPTSRMACPGSWGSARPNTSRSRIASTSTTARLARSPLIHNDLE